MKNRAVLIAVAMGLLGLGSFAIAQTAAKPAAPVAATATPKPAHATPGDRRPASELTLDEVRARVKTRLDQTQKRYDHLMKLTPQQWEEERKKLGERRNKRAAARRGNPAAPAPVEKK